MKENFLHFLWRTRRFDLSNLTTTDGQDLDILDFGQYNALDAGADFQNAKIRLNGLIWYGNIEMHVRSSDWYAHHHQHDAAYQTVILHVVYEQDTPIFRQNTEGGQRSPLKANEETTAEIIPCLVLKNRIPQGLYQHYWALLNNAYWIPCQEHFATVSDFTKDIWLERLLVERLERKTEAIQQRLELNRGDWEEAFWQSLARYFGATVNAEPMTILACGISHLVLAKHKNQLLQIEALLFGQGGFLENDMTAAYPKQLKKEYQFLKQKYQLPPPVNREAWKFSRMRPAHFPTIRIAQLAALIYKSHHLFSKLIDFQSTAQVSDLLDAQASDYWQTHLDFDSPPSPPMEGVLLTKEPYRTVWTERKIGQEMKRLLMINVMAPFLFLYGKNRADESLKIKAFDLLASLKPERNKITEGWQNLGLGLKNAAQTQAVLQLKNEYCDKKRCVECAIGSAILKS